MGNRVLATALAILLCVALGTQFAPPANAKDNAIIIQSTTSTQNSGLLDYLLPQFTKKTGIKAHVVAVGTGQALKNSELGNGDILLVHAKSAEEQFVKKGYGVKRFDVMYNDFVIVGPRKDPAKIASSKSVIDAFSKIANSKSKFASRADNSGTHKKELSLWRMAKQNPVKESGTWYRETGSGMGATLNIASGMSAYTMTDRATWIAFKNKQDLKILVEGNDVLFNQYGVILVNPKRHKHVKQKLGQQFIDWLLGSEGQAAIAKFKIDGKQLFFPNADKFKKTKAAS